MKTTKLLLAAALFTGFATLSFAGPGAQYWTHQAQNQKQIKADAKPAQIAACANCSCAGMKKS
jgi:hypothetical protein